MKNFNYQFIKYFNTVLRYRFIKFMNFWALMTVNMHDESGIISMDNKYYNPSGEGPATRGPGGDSGALSVS